MSDDRRLSIRAALYPLIEAAAERRHVSVAAFASMVVYEYLRERDEVQTTAKTNSAKPNTVSTVPEREVLLGTSSTGPIYGSLARWENMERQRLAMGGKPSTTGPEFKPLPEEGDDDDDWGDMST